MRHGLASRVPARPPLARRVQWRARRSHHAGHRLEQRLQNTIFRSLAAGAILALAAKGEERDILSMLRLGQIVARLDEEGEGLVIGAVEEAVRGALVRLELQNARWRFA